MKKLSLLISLQLFAFTLFSANFNLKWDPVSTSLPEEIKVYSTSSMLNGRVFKAWYAVADLSTGNVELRSIVSPSTKKLSAFAADFGAEALVCVNGGYFTANSPLSYSTDKGINTSINISTLTRGDKTYPVTRGVIGVDKNQNPESGWSYRVNGANWLYPSPVKHIEGNEPLAAPTATLPAGGKEWKEYCAVGGAPLLVKNGVIQFDYQKNSNNKYITNYELLQSDIFGEGLKQPRTAIGYTPDKKMILFVCDGRSDLSTGATLDEVAKIMMDLDCTDVLNLDGGGSSEIIADGSILNTPSDGTERNIINAVMFVKAEPKSDFELMTKSMMWDFTNNSGVKPDPNWLYSSTNARCISTSGDLAFIPIRNAEGGHGLRAINAKTGAFVKVMDQTGLGSGTHPVSGCATTNDGHILVSNLQAAISASAPVRIYHYTDLNAKPSVLLEYGGSSADGTAGKRFGDNFTFDGSMTSGIIRMSSHSIQSKYFEWDVKDGALVSQNPRVISLFDKDGVTPIGSLGSYARVFPVGNGKVWIKGSGYRPRLFHNGVLTGAIAGLKNNMGNAAKPFVYDGRTYLATVDYSTPSAAQAEGVILDVTDGPEGREVFRTEKTFGNIANTNGTDGVDIKVNKDGFDVYFLSATEGVVGYSFKSNVLSEGTLESSLVSFYPNPSKGVIHFTEEVDQVRIISLSGQTVCLGKSCTQLNTSALKGIYLLEMTIDDNKIVQKFVAE